MKPAPVFKSGLLINSKDEKPFPDIFSKRQKKIHLYFICELKCLCISNENTRTLGYKAVEEMVQNDEIESRFIALRLSTETSGFLALLRSDYDDGRYHKTLVFLY